MGYAGDVVAAERLWTLGVELVGQNSALLEIESRVDEGSEVKDISSRNFESEKKEGR